MIDPYLGIRHPDLDVTGNEESLFVNEESFFGYQYVRDIVICEYGILIRG